MFWLLYTFNSQHEPDSWQYSHKWVTSCLLSSLPSIFSFANSMGWKYYAQHHIWSTTTSAIPEKWKVFPIVSYSGAPKHTNPFINLSIKNNIHLWNVAFCDYVIHQIILPIIQVINHSKDYLANTQWEPYFAFVGQYDLQNPCQHVMIDVFIVACFARYSV